VVHGMIEGGHVPGIVAVEANGELHLSQLHQFIPARRAGGCQRDDDVAVQKTGQQQGAQVRRIVAADCKRVAGFYPTLRQFAEPSSPPVEELAKCPSHIAADQRRPTPPRPQPLTHPMTAHASPAVTLRRHSKAYQALPSAWFARDRRLRRIASMTCIIWTACITRAACISSIDCKHSLSLSMSIDPFGRSSSPCEGRKSNGSRKFP